MSSKEERAYIGVLVEEIRRDFDKWSKEYQQPRDLGALGEFANLYRKVRKLKTLMWPGENSRPAEPWREDLRTIAKEVVAHGLLLLVDLDRANGSFGKWVSEETEEEEEPEEDGEPMTSQGVRAQRIRRQAEAARQRRISRELKGPGVVTEDFTPQGKKAQTITDAERQERERIQERLRQKRMQGSAFATTPPKEG